MKMTMICPNCEAKLVAGRYSFEDEYRGETVSFEMDGVGCTECDFRTVKASMAADYARACSDAYRLKLGRLTSSEIRAARTAMEMSQEAFAAFFPVGVASIKRWEGSFAQDEKSDQLLRERLDPARIARGVFDCDWKLAMASGTLFELESLNEVLNSAAKSAFAHVDLASTNILLEPRAAAEWDYVFSSTSWSLPVMQRFVIPAGRSQAGTAKEAAIAANTSLSLAA